MRFKPLWFSRIRPRFTMRNIGNSTFFLFIIVRRVGEIVLPQKENTGDLFQRKPLGKIKEPYKKMIIIASLLEKLPNLAHLTRTSEVKYTIRFSE